MSLAQLIPAWWEQRSTTMAELLGGQAASSPRSGVTAAACPSLPASATNSPRLLAPPEHPQPWPGSYQGEPKHQGSRMMIFSLLSQTSLRSPVLTQFLPSPQDLCSLCSCPQPALTLSGRIHFTTDGRRKLRSTQSHLWQLSPPPPSGAQPHCPGHLREQKGLGLVPFLPQLTSLLPFSSRLCTTRFPLATKHPQLHTQPLRPFPPPPRSCSSHRCVAGRGKMKALRSPLLSLHPPFCFHHPWPSRNREQSSLFG